MMKALRNAQAPRCDPAHHGVAYDHCGPPAAHICTFTALLDEIIITDRYEYFKFKADIYQGLGMGRTPVSTPELFLAQEMEPPFYQGSHLSIRKIPLLTPSPDLW